MNGCNKIARSFLTLFGSRDFSQSVGSTDMEILESTRKRKGRGGEAINTGIIGDFGIPQEKFREFREFKNSKIEIGIRECLDTG